MKLWLSLEEDPSPCAGALRLCMLVGTRPNEAQLARRREFELDAEGQVEWWEIPAARFDDNGDFIGGMKAKDVGQRIWVGTKLGRELLRDLGQKDWLFPSDSGGAISQYQIGKACNLHKEKTGVKDWTPKVLRKSMSTLMVSDLRVDRFIRSLCLHHTSELKGSIADKHYTAYDYGAEKAEAWTLWADALRDRIEAMRS